MKIRHYRGGPLAGVLALAIFAGLVFLLIFVPAKVVGESFARLGLTPILGLVLLGAMFIWRGAGLWLYKSKRLVRETSYRMNPLAGFLGVPLEAMAERGDELKAQIIGVSVGGVLLPLAVSGWFLYHFAADTQAVLLTAGAALVVAVVAGALVRPGYMSGLSLPAWAPPLATLLGSLLFIGHPEAPRMAYVAACTGTLVGAGLFPLLAPHLRNNIEAQRVLVGGPDVFGGIFLAQIAAGIVT